MKIEKNNHYFTLGVYIVATVLIIFLGGALIFSISHIWHFIILFLKKTWEILTPLTLGLLIAYLLDPLVDFYYKKCTFISKEKRARALATLLMSLTILAFIGLFILLIRMNMTKILGKDTALQMISNMQSYIDQFEYILSDMTKKIEALNITYLNHQVMTKLYQLSQKVIFEITNQTMNSILALASNLVNIGLAIVIAIYLLQDKKYLLAVWKNVLNKLFTRRIGKEICSVGRDINNVFSGYIRGQLIDASLMAILISLALTVIQLDFAVIIGIIAGIFNIIPYFGPIVGFILAGFVGMIGPNPQKGLYAMLAVVAIQQLDGCVIVPRIMKKTVRIHPVVVLLSIIIGGNLWGLKGILLGIPIAALIRLLIIRYIGDIFAVS